MFPVILIAKADVSMVINKACDNNATCMYGVYAFVTYINITLSTH